jgi:hypothetical protein
VGHGWDEGGRMNVLEAFPELEDLPTNCYLVGGAARHAIGKDPEDPKDFDVMFDSLESMFHWCIETQTFPILVRQGSMGTCYTGNVGDIPFELWINPVSSLENYLEGVPTNVDGIAVRFDGKSLVVQTSSDFYGPYKERPTSQVIRTGSFKKHVYRMRKKFQSNNKEEE